jgi:SecD/SecF fusion protein
MANQPRGMQFLINTSESDPTKVQDELKKVFADKLAHNSVDFTTPEKVSAAAAAKKTPAEKPASPAVGSPKKQAEPLKGQSRSNLPSRSLLAFAGDDSLALALAEPAKSAAKPAEKAAASGAKAETKSPAAEKSPPPPPAEAVAPKLPAEAPSAAADAFVGGSRAVLTFKWAVNHDTVEQMLEAAMKTTGIGSAATHHEFSNPDYAEGERVPYPQWTLRIMLPPDKVTPLLAEMQKQVASNPIFPASSQIGSAVAGYTRYIAVCALVASWVCIIIYLWVRFQGVAFGVAAVVALVHDVFVMLGGIAISYYVADYLGFLLVDQFKINLTIVAAFLTIIGYSVNDTIVVFDRIREVRGKDPNVTRKMVNDSVNQTLSRTLLTSLTVFMVVVVLYFAGGEAVHGFAFALIIGVATGTYSSIYIAAPILLWLVGKRHHVAALIERKSH